MKIREMSDSSLFIWLEDKASLNSLNLPDRMALKGVCNFLRTNFGGLDEKDLEKSFTMWMMGDLPNVKRRGNSLDAYLLGQILGDYRRGSNGLYGNEDGKEDRLDRAEQYLNERNERLSNEFVGLLVNSHKEEWKRIRRICRERREFTYSEIIANLDAHRFGAAFGLWWNGGEENQNLILAKL